METIEENSVILNWNHEDAAIDSTRGDTTLIANKDDNDKLMEGECQFSKSLIESRKMLVINVN